jgi:hypothetical protein
MCPVASDLASRLRGGGALALPCVPRLRTSLPCWEGLRCHHMAYDSGPHLPVGECFGATTCPKVLYGLQDSYIKKGIAGLPMQLGSRAFNAHSCVSMTHLHVSKVHDARAIMACKTCGHATPSWPTRCANRRLQCSAGPVDHSRDTTIVRGGPIGWHHTADNT